LQQSGSLVRRGCRWWSSGWCARSRIRAVAVRAGGAGIFYKHRNAGRRAALRVKAGALEHHITV